MSDPARTASGGVRNLRAMFENKDSDSSTGSPKASPLPNRGRSPAPGKNNSPSSIPQSPTPLNKVRTNFVAVDKNSHHQTQPAPQEQQPSTPQISYITKNSKPDTEEIVAAVAKEADEIETMSRRRDSFSLHDDLPLDHKSIVERKKSIAEEFAAREHSLQTCESIPEFAVETPALETPAVEAHRKSHQLGYSESPAASSSSNPDKPTAAQEPGTRLAASDPTSESAVTDGKALQGSSIKNLKGADAETLKAAAGTGAKVAPLKAVVAPGRPAPTSRTLTASSTKKSPNVSPAVSRNPSAKNVTEANATKPLAASANGAPKARSPGAAPAQPGAKKGTGPTPSSTGFVKPKPRSPTRPARLPESLMAPTASSRSKTGTSTDDSSQRRGSGASVPSNVNKSSVERAPSRSRPDAVRPPNNHNRPSLGPPPKKDNDVKKPSPRQSLSNKSGASSDDGFLARMMRPTTASASKVHDKPIGVGPNAKKVHRDPPIIMPIIKKDGEKKETAEPVAAPAAKPEAAKKKVSEPIIVPIPKAEGEKKKAEPIIMPIPKKGESTDPEATPSPQRKSRTLSKGFLPIPQIRKKSDAKKEEPIIVPTPGSSHHKKNHSFASSHGSIHPPASIQEEEEEPDMEDTKPASPSTKSGEKLAKDAVDSTHEHLDQTSVEAAAAVVDQVKKEENLTKSETEIVASQLESFRLTNEAAETKKTDDAADKVQASSDAAASRTTSEKAQVQAHKADAKEKHEEEVIDAAISDAKTEAKDKAATGAVQAKAQSSKLTSEMLSGSALDTDDEMSPAVEKKNPLIDQRDLRLSAISPKSEVPLQLLEKELGHSGPGANGEGVPETVVEAPEGVEEQAEGEKEVQDRKASAEKKEEDKKVMEEGALAIDEEIKELDEQSLEKKAKEGQLFVEGEVDEMKVDDKVEKTDVTALAS